MGTTVYRRGRLRPAAGVSRLKGRAELLEEGNIYNDVVSYLQTLPVKLPDPRYAVEIGTEKIYSLAMEK